MSDRDTTLAQLKSLMYEFVAARDWHQYHDAKNLSTSIAIEAAELMEHFQWLHSDAVGDVRRDPKQMAEIREEVADILAYLLSFASQMGIDMSEALVDKLKKNADKYPVERYYGKFKADDPPR